MTACGIARVVDDRVEAWQTFRSKPSKTDKKTDDLAKRAFELARDVRHFWSGSYAVICVEAQQGASFGKQMAGAMGSALKLGVAYGAVLGACEQPPIVIHPSEVRRRLLGRMSASKEDIREAVRSRIKHFPPEPKTKGEREAVYDAVAVVLALKPELDRLATIAGVSST